MDSQRMPSRRPGTTRRTHLTSANFASKTPHLLNYWYVKFHPSFYETAEKNNEYKNNDILAKLELLENTDEKNHHSFDAKRIISNILQPGMDLLVVQKESSDQTFISGLPEFSNHADIEQDMRPDVVICPQVHGCTFPIAVAEVISAGKTKLQAFYQASAYAMFMARLYAHFGIEHPGYCIVFPNPRKEDLFGISIVKCQWDYTSCHFLFSANSLNCVLAEIKVGILGILPSPDDRRLAVERFINGFEHVSKYIFKLQLESVNACFDGKYEAVEQLSSSHAIVLKVKQRDAAAEEELVIKVVSSSVYGTLTRFKDRCLQSPYLIHHLASVELFPNNQKCVAITFPYLVPPLTAEEARRCLKDFVKKINKALESIHQAKFHHGDIRLENICFVPKGDTDYDVCLIDLEMGYVGEAALCSDVYSEYSDISCLYRIPETFGNGDIDYLQLGYMILWVCTDCNDYHNLDKLPSRGPDPFIDDLLQRGVFGNIEASTVFGEDESSLFDVLQSRGQEGRRGGRGQERIERERKQGRRSAAGGRPVRDAPPPSKRRRHEGD